MSTRTDGPRKVLPLLAGGILVICILPLFFIDLTLLSGGRSPPSELSQIAHVGFFSLLTILLLLAIRPGSRKGVVLVSATLFLFGVAVELLQHLSGREASLSDLALNATGIVFGVALVHASRAPLAASLATGLVVVMLWQPGLGLWDRWQAYRQFPVLSDFSTRLEHRRWSRGEPVLLPDGRRALQLSLPPAPYPGASLYRSLGDWRGSDCLVALLYNPDDEPLKLTLSIRDQAHEQRGGQYSDRFNHGFDLPPGRHAVVIGTARIRNAPRERELDLANLTELVLFTRQPEKLRRLYVERVYLSFKGHKYRSNSTMCKFCEQHHQAGETVFAVLPTPPH